MSLLVQSKSECSLKELLTWPCVLLTREDIGDFLKRSQGQMCREMPPLYALFLVVMSGNGSSFKSKNMGHLLNPKLFPAPLS